MKISRLILLAILIPVLSGCFKKDEPVVPFDRGDSVEALIDMGVGYTNQVYYSLDQQAVVKMTNRLEWDIALENAPGDPVIRMNTSRGMYAADITGLKFSEVQDTSGLEFKWDMSSGNPDSTGIQLDSTNSGQFVINMGYGENSELIGFRKVILQVSGDTMSIQWSSMDNSETGGGMVIRDTIYNSVQYSILYDHSTQVEPPKDQYDLFFTQYLYYFIEEDIPYIVSGVLLNPYKVEAAHFPKNDFTSFNLSDLQNAELSTKADIIGYDWKWYNLDEGVYTVRSDDVYGILSHSGFFYKLHFIDFYNNEGQSGFPRLVQQRL